MIIAHREVVERHVERLGSAGIRLTRVEASTLSLARLLRSVGEYADTSVSLLRDGASDREYFRLERGLLAFSRGADLTENAEEMVRRSEDLDRKQHGASPPSHLVVLDETGSAGRLSNVASQVVSIADLDVPILNGSPPLTAAQAASVGAALLIPDAESTNDLLPEREVHRLALRRAVRAGSILAASAVWFGALLYGAGWFLMDAESSYIEETRAAITVLRAQTGDLDAQADQLELLQGETALVSLPLRFVLDLHERTPLSIGISHMRYDARGSLVLSGEAPSYSAMFSYVKALSESPLIVDTKLEYGTRPLSSSDQLVDFKITCELAGGNSTRR